LGAPDSAVIQRRRQLSIRRVVRFFGSRPEDLAISLVTVTASFLRPRNAWALIRGHVTAAGGSVDCCSYEPGIKSKTGAKSVIEASI
jgi:hypothetical protein